MIPIFVPKWVKPHLYLDKKFADLSAAEIQDLRNRLGKFKSAEPDVSIVIPAWNEANNIFRTLSSLASNVSSLNVEIIVINNNSTDFLQDVLDSLGVDNYFENKQGIAFARQLGLEVAKGKYYLSADADTFYPPFWIELMIKPMLKSENVVGVYGYYAFLPIKGYSRHKFWLYEFFTRIIISIRKKNQEFINVLGFNMGFLTELALSVGGFKTNQARVFNNELNIEESEDGRLAVRLKANGILKMVNDAQAIVFTSPRKVLQDGGILKAFINRFKKHAARIREYI